jgi:hypothetical protein
MIRIGDFVDVVVVVDDEIKIIFFSDFSFSYNNNNNNFPTTESYRLTRRFLVLLLQLRPSLFHHVVGSVVVDIDVVVVWDVADDPVDKNSVPFLVLK